MVQRVRRPAGAKQLGPHGNEIIGHERIERARVPAHGAPWTVSEPLADLGVFMQRRAPEPLLNLTDAQEVVYRAPEGPPVVRNGPGVVVKESLSSGVRLRLGHVPGRGPARLEPCLAEHLPRVLAARKPVAELPYRDIAPLAAVRLREPHRAV